MDDIHRNALVRIRDADPPMTMDTFIAMHDPVSRMLYQDLSSPGLVVKRGDETLHITDAGRAALVSA